MSRPTCSPQIYGLMLYTHLRGTANDMNQVWCCVLWRFINNAIDTIMPSKYKGKICKNRAVNHLKFHRQFLAIALFYCLLCQNMKG